MCRFWYLLIPLILIQISCNSQKLPRVVVPDDVPTIEEAYAMVEDGGTVTIKPGEYELSGTLVIDRKVTFRGKADAPKDVVIKCPDSNAFQIIGDSPSFYNLTVGTNAEMNKEAISSDEMVSGFYITGGTPKLLNCIISSKKAIGIVISGKDSNPLVEKCIMKECLGGAFVMQEGGGEFRECEFIGKMWTGIMVQESANPTFTKCKINDSSVGAGIRDGGRGEFHFCEFCGSSYIGISVSSSGDPKVYFCKIHDGESGIQIDDNGLGEFSCCKIYRNEKEGIEVKDQGNPTVTSCEIHSGKSYGIHVHDRGKGAFRDNTLSENYHEEKLSNWFIESNAGTVRGSGNTPEMPGRDISR